jgi:hypothetical protein
VDDQDLAVSMGFTDRSRSASTVCSLTSIGPRERWI